MEVEVRDFLKGRRVEIKQEMFGQRFTGTVVGVSAELVTVFIDGYEVPETFKPSELKLL